MLLASTQIVISCAPDSGQRALDIPKSKIRVTKPRIGGGFGAKQTVVTRSLSGLCDLDDQRDRAKLIYSEEGVSDRFFTTATRWK